MSSSSAKIHWTKRKPLQRRKKERVCAQKNNNPKYHGRRKDFFQEVGNRGFFQRGPKVVKIPFFLSKLRKQPFLLEM